MSLHGSIFWQYRIGVGLRVKRVQANEPGAGRTCGLHHSTAGHTQNSKPYLHSISLAKVFKRCWIWAQVDMPLASKPSNDRQWWLKPRQCRGSGWVRARKRFFRFFFVLGCPLAPTLSSVRRIQTYSNVTLYLRQLLQAGAVSSRLVPATPQGARLNNAKYKSLQVSLGKSTVRTPALHKRDWQCSPNFTFQHGSNPQSLTTCAPSKRFVRLGLALVAKPQK